MELHYTTMGQGPYLFLIHGFLENHKMWLPMAKEFSKTHTVIMPDLAGHGKSPVLGEAHSMELQAGLVLDIYTQLNIESAILIGHSMGGYVALTLAQKFPEKVNGLCLFFSTSKADSDEKKKQRMEAVKTVEDNRKGFIDKSIPKLFGPKKIESLANEIELAKSWAMDMPQKGITAALKGMAERADTTQVLETAPFPILILLGEFDGAVNAAEFKKIIPERENITVKTLPTGHMGHLEAPDTSLELLKGFLRKSSV